jgi:predicted Zn finger-like uncharacterized protein
MDVRCQKCGIEYEFDDAKVTAAGVTVKCTNCGHVFKVKRDEAAIALAAFGPGANMAQDLPRTATATTLPPVNPKGDGAEWMVRQPNGSVFRFKELTTLQKWIVERKVNREDEISKTGKSWKKLGDIAELASFFQVVDAANAALSASIVPVQPAMSSQASPPQVTTQSVQPGFVVVHQHQSGQTQVGMSAVQMPHGDPQPASPQAPSVPLPAPAPSLAPTPAAPQRKPAPATVDDLDDDDPVAQWGKQRRRRNVAMLFVVALAVAVGVLIALKPPFVTALLGGDASAGLDVDGVYKAVRDDDASSFKSATAGLKAAPPSALSSALEARLLCAEASLAREEERLHGVLRALAPAEASKHDAAADAANQRAAELLSRAYPLVNDVRAQAPKLAEAHLAAAAYNLEKGGLAELKTDLENARAAAAPVEKGRLDAEIGALQVLSDVRAAAQKLDAASLAAAADKVPAASDPRLIYAKAALAVTALARTPLIAGQPVDVGAARALVDALPVKDARAALLAEILGTLAAPVIADAGAVADAGTVAAVDAGAVITPDAGAVADAAPETYESLMQRAERASVNEKPAAARDFFQRALKQRPGSVRANIGLGWACLDLDKNAEAQKAFRKAVSLDEGNSDAHFGLAEALRFGGNKTAALEEYKAYLRLDPNGKEASVAKRAIEALQ